MEGATKILKRVKKKVEAVTYGNPLYKFVLNQGPVPDRVRLCVPDPWPGDAQEGQALLTDQPALFESTEGAAKHVLEAGFISARGLRNLRAVGTEAARQKAASLIVAALDHLEEWQEDNWAPDALGERLAAWISFYDFYAPAMPAAFQDRLIAGMVHQLRHLLRIQPTTLTGSANLKVIKGLIYGGLGLIESEKSLSVALDLLGRQLEIEILADGGHISRNPSELLHALRHLIDIRAALTAVQIEVPHALSFAIERMVPALKALRHGDGSLVLFHGGREETSLWIDAAMSLSDARARVLRRLPQMGYERITAGRSLLMIDAAMPALRPFDKQAHAGLMSFEFSVGRERLIVNCGAAPLEGNAEWRQAMAATAAHSTLTVDDMNACEVLETGGLGHRPKQMASQRYEQEGVQFIEMMHDGYFPRHRIVCQRVLSLSVDGEELRGREILEGPPNRDFAVRWHLHPSVRASLAHGGQTALLRTASGSGWRLRAMGGDLALEPSVYCGTNTPRRSLQLRLSGRTNADATILEWSLVREKKS